MPSFNNTQRNELSASPPSCDLIAPNDVVIAALEVLEAAFAINCKSASDGRVLSSEAPLSLTLNPQNNFKKWSHVLS